jgi:hypothetical protein
MEINITVSVIPQQALFILEPHNVVMCYLTFLHR